MFSTLLTTSNRYGEYCVLKQNLSSISLDFIIYQWKIDGFAGNTVYAGGFFSVKSAF